MRKTLLSEERNSPILCLLLLVEVIHTCHCFPPFSLPALFGFSLQSDWELVAPIGVETVGRQAWERGEKRDKRGGVRSNFAWRPNIFCTPTVVPTLACTIKGEKGSCPVHRFFFNSPSPFPLLIGCVIPILYSSHLFPPFSHLILPARLSFLTTTRNDQPFTIFTSSLSVGCLSASFASVRCFHLLLFWSCALLSSLSTWKKVS